MEKAVNPNGYGAERNYVKMKTQRRLTGKTTADDNNELVPYKKVS
jgi:hypothetical protein